MNRHKVMVIIPGMDMGGAELQLTQKLKLFPELDITLSVLSDRHTLLRNIPLSAHQVRVYNRTSLRHLNGRGILKAIPVAWRIAKHCRAESIRTVIAHLPMAHWTARLMVLLSYLSFYRIRLIAYHHSEQYKANPVEGFFHKAFTSINAMLAYLTDAGNIFVSQAVKTDISRHQYVRNGIIIKNLVEEKNGSSGLAQDIIVEQKKKFKKLLVIPGRIQPVKGQLFFVQALTTALSDKVRSTDTLIVFAGGGSGQQLAQAIPEALSNNVLITGELEHEVMLSFLSLADLVVIPSLSEGLGNTLIESMMLKRNVISSTAGGLQETIQQSDAVEWFDAGDAGKLQQKLTAWLAGELSFQPEKAYAYYVANFSPEVHRVAMLQYLNQTLSA